MMRLIFTNWKVAALWVVGLVSMVGVFFSDGGGHEQLEESAQQVRHAKEIAKGGAAAEAEPVDLGEAQVVDPGTLDEARQDARLDAMAGPQERADPVEDKPEAEAEEPEAEGE